MAHRAGQSNPLCCLQCNIQECGQVYHGFNDENCDYDDDNNVDDDGVSIMEMYSFLREKLTRASLIGENMTSLTEPQSVTRS